MSYDSLNKSLWTQHGPHDYEMQVHCTVYSARRTSTTAVGHATHVRRTSTTLALKGLTVEQM